MKAENFWSLILATALLLQGILASPRPLLRGLVHAPRILSETSPAEGAPQKQTIFRTGLKFNDITRVDPKDKHPVRCFNLFEEASKLSCGGSGLNGDSLFEEIFTGQLFENISGKGKLRGAFYLLIEKISDQQILQRKVRGYQLRQNLDPKKVLTVMAVEAQQDFLSVLFNYGYYFRIDLSDLILEKQVKKDVKYQRAFKDAFERVRYLHQNSIVALNFGFSVPATTNTYITVRISDLGCGVRKGEPVGKCNFAPLFTDPRVLNSDGSLLADEAMDYYSFGAIVYMKSMNSGKFNLLTDESRLEYYTEQMKEGKISIPKGTDRALAILVCVLLQSDVKARMNDKMIDFLLNEIAERNGPRVLTEDVVFDLKTSPMDIPQFRDELIYAGILHPETDKKDSDSKSNAENGKSAEGQGSVSGNSSDGKKSMVAWPEHWSLSLKISIGVLILVVLVIIALLVFWPKAKEEQPEVLGAPGTIKKQLEETNAEQPETTGV